MLATGVSPGIVVKSGKRLKGRHKDVADVSHLRCWLIRSTENPRASVPSRK
jgi:hypothetical protein